MHVELAVTEVGLSRLHAVKTFLEVTDECLDNGCQIITTISVAIVRSYNNIILLGRMFPWQLVISQW